LAQKLIQYFEFVEKEGGLVGRMRLAMKTKIATEEAEKIPDSAENIAKFQKVLSDNQ